MSQTLRSKTYNEFIDEFGGFQADEDGLPVEIDFADHKAIVAAHEAQCLWTEYDDGHLENRIGFVNRCRYLKSVVSYAEEVLIIVDAPEWPF